MATANARLHAADIRRRSRRIASLDEHGSVIQKERMSYSTTQSLQHMEIKKVLKAEKKASRSPQFYQRECRESHAWDNPALSCGAAAILCTQSHMSFLTIRDQIEKALSVNLSVVDH
jgi:hypothetical protein